MQGSFFEFADEQVLGELGLMTGIFRILESSATQSYQDVARTQEFFFHRHIYSL